MNGNSNTDQGTWMLYRIVALLIALAGLAERAASLSPSARSAVLWILRPTEVRIRKWLLRDTTEFISSYHIRDGDTPADAYALADRYMELAAILDDMLAYEAQMAVQEFDRCLPMSSPRAARLEPVFTIRPASLRAVIAGPIPDT